MDANNKKILLMLAPYHPPLVPPLGLSCLKGFMESHGYVVTIVDANSSEELRKYNFRYFDALKEHIPGEKQGNFYNIGNEVLRNHMMACISYKNEKEYENLVKTIIAKTFFCDIGNEPIRELNRILKKYFADLKKYFLHLLAKEKPNVVGLSVFKVTLPSSIFLFKLTKETNPGILTVMGGGTFSDQLALGSPDLEYFAGNTPYIDKILIGEGEILFLKLLNGELPGNRKIYSLQDIQPHYIDVSSVKIPDYSGLDVGYYPYLSYFTSRSCPFQCAFCGETVIWGKYRKKSKEQIVNEMRELYEKYNRPMFLMCDSLLNPTADIISEGLMENNLPLYWDGYLRVDKPVCDSNNTMKWRKGGYYRARLGVESGSQRILDLMNKNITTNQIKTAVSSLALAGIKTTTYWIIGFPGETEEDFQKTLNLIEEIKDDIYEAEANLFWYFPNALVESDAWSKHAALLYPESSREMLMLQTQYLKLEPSQEESHRRLNRFVRHCSRLGIPNPYSLADIYKADERWKQLHQNAAPSLVEFYNKNLEDPIRFPHTVSTIIEIFPPVRLPDDRINNLPLEGPSMLLELKIGPELTGKLREVASTEDTDNFVAMLAVINAWISIISDQTSFSIGAVFPGTTLPVPVCVNLSGNPDFRQVLSLTKEAALNAYKTYDRSKSEGENSDNNNISPIVIIGHKPVQRDGDDWNNTEDKWNQYDYEIKNDLQMEMMEENDWIIFSIRYNPRMYRKETIELYFDRFKTASENLLHSLNLHISQLQDLNTGVLSEIF